MNIGLICHDIPDLTGMGTQYYLVARYLGEYGHNVVLIKTVEKTADRIRSNPFPGVTVIQVPAQISHQSLFRSVVARIPLLKSLSSFSPFDIFTLKMAVTLNTLLPRIIDEHAIDIIEAPDARCELAFYSARQTIPTIVNIRCPPYLGHFHDDLPEIAPFNPTLFALQKQSIKNCTGLLAVSRSVLERSHALYGEQIRRGRVIYNLVEFAPETDRYFDDRPTIVYIGRLAFNKGIDILLEALPIVAREISGVKIQFVGEADADSLTKLERLQMSLKHPIDIESHGRVGADQVKEIVCRAWLLAYPSRWDSLPNAVLEAASLKIPTVAVAVGGMPEIIDHGVSGILLANHDPVGFADALIKLLGDREACRDLGEAAFRKMKKFHDPKKIIEQRLCYYDEILSLNK